MATIVRTPQVDDDGTGTTGTIWNNAWKQEFYNQIDAALAAAGAAATGPFTVPGLLTLGTGQIKFPATWTPSADPNTLDDFERGTFVPTLQFGGASVGITYSRQLGRYVKLAELVFVRIRLIVTSKGTSTGAATIAGLPFPQIADQIGAAGKASVAGFTGLVGPVDAYVSAPNASLVALYEHTATGTVNLTDAKFSATGTDLSIALTYATG